MRRWVTHIEAIDYKDRGLKLWVGPYIEAPTKKLAQEYCDNNGLGYCRVIAEVVGEGYIENDEIKWLPNYNLN